MLEEVSYLGDLEGGRLASLMDSWQDDSAERGVLAIVAEASLVARGIAQAKRPASGSAPPVLLLLFDALLPNIASILDALYLEMADSVSYLGACAGSETLQPLAHGYSIPEDSLCATATAGNRIVSIGWKPAFEVYRAEVKSHFGVDLDRENFYQWAVHFPFGIYMASGRALVRIPVALDEDGAIFCVGEVPENSILSMLEAPKVDSKKTVESLVGKLGKGRADLLAFYCAARRLHLGEIGSFEPGGYPYFHNASIVTVGWSGT